MKTRFIPILAAILLATTAAAQRLPGNVVPAHYAIRMEPDLEHESFKGEETIDVELKERVQSIVLNAVTLQLHDVKVNND